MKKTKKAENMISQGTIDFIHKLQGTEKNPSLERINKILELMGNPQDKLKFIHVAGTNGKGSVCAMLSHMLTEAGYKTGLNISPFVLEFRERIQINNQMIPDEELAEIGEYVKGLWSQLKYHGYELNGFEVIFAISLEYFARSGCDIVVVEVGLGGRFDATNAISTPLASAITSISMDHTQILGNSIEEIAKVKAGIIKPDGTTVCYSQQDPNVIATIMEACAENNNQLIVPHRAEILQVDLSGNKFRYDGFEYNLPLIGEHQIYNALVVLEVCRVIEKKGFPLSQQQIFDGMAKTKFPSRLEILSQEPLVILDGAHNIGGIKSLIKSFDLLKGRKIRGIMGMVSDKDIDGVIEIIGPYFESVVTTWDPGNPRFMEPEILAEKLDKYCPNVSVEKDPIKAYKKALAQVNEDDMVLICGSLYLGSVIRNAVEK